MATQEKTWNVANRLHSLKDSDNPEVNHIIAGADEIYDDAKGAKQSDINAQTDAALADRYTKAETYSKEQLDALITTPDVNYVTVVATNATTAVTDILPATGEANTIYRVGNWNGTQYDPTMYALFAWNGTTYVCLAVRSFVGEVYDVSVNHPDGQGNPTPYADLTAALGTDGENIPADIRRGGMSIKFIQGNAQSSDNKYVQYRLMADSFSTTVSDWQGVDDEPTAGSENLVKSGGVAAQISQLGQDVIKHTVQDLTEEQKAQARANIGAAQEGGDDFLTTEDIVDGFTGGGNKVLSADAGSLLNAYINGGTIDTALAWVKGSTLTKYGQIYSPGNQAICRLTDPIWCNTGDVLHYGKATELNIGVRSGTSGNYSLAKSEASLSSDPVEDSFTVQTAGYYMIGTYTVGFNLVAPYVSAQVEGLAPVVEDMKETLDSVNLTEMDAKVKGTAFITNPEIVTGQYISSYGRLVSGQPATYCRTVPIPVSKGYRAKIYNPCSICYNATGNISDLWSVQAVSEVVTSYTWVAKEDGYVVFSGLTANISPVLPEVYPVVAVDLDDVRNVLDGTYKKVFQDQLTIDQICLGKIHANIKSTTNIVLYGDSIFSSDNGGTGGWLASQLAEITGANVQALGWPGYTTADIAASNRMARIWNNNPDIIILEYGGNENGAAGSVGTFDGSIYGEPIVEPVDIDSEYSGTYMIQALDYMVRKIKAYYYNLRERAGAEIGVAYTQEQAESVAAMKKPFLVCTTCLPQRRHGESAPFSLRANHIRKRNAMVEVCNRNGVLCCDTFNLWDVDITKEPIYISVDLNFVNKGNYTCDGVHPNIYGYERLARVIAGAIM